MAIRFLSEEIKVVLNPLIFLLKPHLFFKEKSWKKLKEQ